MISAPLAASIAGPAVVASVPPVHSIVAGVMQGLGEPHLLVTGGASPHTYAIKPSDARRLAGADIIFWVGRDLENFLAKALENLGAGADIIELSQTPGIKLLPVREGGIWPEHHDDDSHADDQHDEVPAEADHDHGAVDLHIWLDPSNAAAIAQIAADVLARLDPERADAYADNAARIARRIKALDAELRATLAPVAGRPFVVFHDAYQYFEKAYGIRAIGTVTVSPDRLPGARRLSELHDAFADAGARCIFREPQFSPKIAEALVAGTDVRPGILDPLGADLAAGPDLYFDLMRDNAAGLVDCLE